MTTMAMSEIPLETTNPAQRLRRMAAAVRVAFTWWGVHRTLSVQQKEEVCDAYGADARLLSAGKKIVDVRHEAFRRLTSVRSRIASHWRSLTLPYVEPGIRLIKQSDIAPFVDSMEEFRHEVAMAERGLDAVYDAMKADARRRLGKLFNAADDLDQLVQQTRMRQGNTLSSIVVGAVIVAVLSALLIQDRWVVAFPTLLALYVVWRLKNVLQRR